MGNVALIEPSEWARRKRIILDVRDSSRLDGRESSPEVQRLQDQWVEGEITLDELHDRVQKVTELRE